MGLFKSSLDIFLENASDEELDAAIREKHRQWCANNFGGNGKKTPEMIQMEKEQSRRSAEKWVKNPNRNTDPNYRWTDENRWDKD